MCNTKKANQYSYSKNAPEKYIGGRWAKTYVLSYVVYAIFICRLKGIHINCNWTDRVEKVFYFKRILYYFSFNLISNNKKKTCSTKCYMFYTLCLYAQCFCCCCCCILGNSISPLFGTKDMCFLCTYFFLNLFSHCFCPFDHDFLLK